LCHKLLTLLISVLGQYACIETVLTIKQETKKKAEAISELHIPDRNNQKNRKLRKQRTEEGNHTINN